MVRSKRNQRGSFREAVGVHHIEHVLHITWLCNRGPQDFTNQKKKKKKEELLQRQTPIATV